MSIASEIKRIQYAKEGLRRALNNRRCNISSDTKIYDYYQVISALPCTTRGTFTPEKDTHSITIQVPYFTPEFFYFYSDEVRNESGVTSASVDCKASKNCGYNFSIYKNDSGAIKYATKNNGVTFKTNSIVITLSSATWFRAGYTYKYYVAGRFSE